MTFKMTLKKAILLFLLLATSFKEASSTGAIHENIDGEGNNGKLWSSYNYENINSNGGHHKDSDPHVGFSSEVDNNERMGALLKSVKDFLRFEEAFEGRDYYQGLFRQTDAYLLFVHEVISSLRKTKDFKKLSREEGYDPSESCALSDSLEQSKDSEFLKDGYREMFIYKISLAFFDENAVLLRRNVKRVNPDYTPTTAQDFYKIRFSLLHDKLKRKNTRLLEKSMPTILRVIQVIAEDQEAFKTTYEEKLVKLLESHQALKFLTVTHQLVSSVSQFAQSYNEPLESLYKNLWNYFPESNAAKEVDISFHIDTLNRLHTMPALLGDLASTYADTIATLEAGGVPDDNPRSRSFSDLGEKKRLSLDLSALPSGKKKEVKKSNSDRDVYGKLTSRRKRKDEGEKPGRNKSSDNIKNSLENLKSKVRKPTPRHRPDSPTKNLVDPKKESAPPEPLTSPRSPKKKVTRTSSSSPKRTKSPRKSSAQKSPRKTSEKKGSPKTEKKASPKKKTKKQSPDLSETRVIDLADRGAGGRRVSSVF